MANRLRQRFDWVRKLFFPRWDRDRQWKIRNLPDLHGASGCVWLPTKTIKLAGIPEDQDDLHALLIHEIVHVVTGSGHGKKWQSRMEKAAQRADDLNHSGLAELLRSETCQYQQAIAAHVGCATMVYGRIEDLVVIDNVTAKGRTFLNVVDYVRRELGMSRRDFLLTYQGARQAFDNAVEERRQYDETARRFEEWRRQGKSDKT